MKEKEDKNYKMAEKGKEEEVAITNSEEKQAETIIVKVDAHIGETKTTKQSLLDDRSRTGFAIGDRKCVG